MLFLLLSTALLPTARAEEAAPPEPPPADDGGSDNFFWVGGGLAVRPGFSQDTFTLGGEAEADVRFGAGMVSGRFDLDFNANVLPEVEIVKALPDVTVMDTIRPEYAQLQVSGETWAARGGILNPNFGLEDWDDWQLYLPTHSMNFSPSPGRMAGSEFGWTFGEGGPEVSVGGGVDLDYDMPIVEANVAYEGDVFSTWSGVAVFPADEQYMVLLAGEIYPAEIVTIGIDGLAGMTAGSPYAALSVVGVLLPEGLVSPTARVEYQFDPDDYTGNPAWTVSAGGTVSPADWAKFLIEAKVLGTTGEPVPGVYASLCVFRPEPEE